MGSFHSSGCASLYQCSSNNQVSQDPSLKTKKTKSFGTHKDEVIELTDASISDLVIVEGNKCSDEIINFLSSTCEKISDEREANSHQENPLLFQFKCNEEFSAENHQKLSSILKNESAVLLFECQNERRTTIYWKSEEIDELLQLKHSKKLNFDEEQKLFNFVASFLARSLKNNHLGTVSQFSYQHGLKPLDLDLIADLRNFNLLLLAVEAGNTEVVEILLKLDLSTISQDNKFDAQTLAMERQHFDAVNVMLQNNLKFPTSFVASNCKGKLKLFCKATEEVHNMIRENETEKLVEILDQHQKLHHFYNFSNESALKVAIESESFEVFDLLLSKRLRFGAHENPAEYYDKLDILSKRKVRDIQNKYAQSFLEKHIHTLVLNSKACYDEAETNDKVCYVQRVFKLLNENPLIKIILMIVAASRNFKIVFDFNREAVNILDPTTTEFTQGIFYLSGKIFIGAKQLLNPKTVNETLAVLAHELCHFVMNLVYKNHAKPYKSQDIKSLEAFEELSKACETQSEEEEVIGSVFESYPEEMHHAELIVRVVHLLALYRDMPDVIAEKRRIFLKLFEFYEKKIVPELEQSLIELEGRDEMELIKKDKKISKLTKISIIGGILSVVGVLAAILIAFMLYNPTYKFNELSYKNRQLVLRAPIKYKQTNVKLGDLFLENSTVLSYLTSNHISEVFKGQVLDFDDVNLAYLNNKIVHSWVNLSEKLKDKILNTNFTFQNEIIKLRDLYEESSQVFNSLNHKQILDVLDGKMLVVHEMIKPDSRFYFERRLWDENMFAIYFNFMTFVKEGLPYFCHAYNNTRSNKTFETFYYEHISQPILRQMNTINEIGQDSEYKKCTLSDFKISKVYTNEVEDDLLAHKSLQLKFDNVLDLANKTKFFILSGEAGTGKTVTFEHLTVEIKHKLPTKWVSYIDLKDFKEFYKKIKTLEDVKEMLKKIFKLSSKNEFEMEIFDEFFDLGNLILLWNGFDEISPGFSEAVINILSLIRNNTENIQFICTRPLYSNRLKLNPDDKVYSLIPLDKKDQEEYIKSFLKTLNVENSKIQKFFSKVQKIINSTESDEDFSTPLMLGMIAELVATEVEIYESENIFQIYQKFVEKKIEIWQNKSEFGKNFSNKLAFEYRGFDMIKVYQSYAIKNEIVGRKFAYFYLLNLNVLRQSVPKELTNDEISRMGILYINGPKTFKFAHRTFLEFFIAQYFIDNIYNSKDLFISNEEAKLRVFLFQKNFYFNGILKFLDSYLKTGIQNLPLIPQIANVFKTNFRHLFIHFFSYYELSDKMFKTFFFLIKNNHEILKKMLYIDEDRTVYTRLLTYNDFIDSDVWYKGIQFKNIENYFMFKNYIKSHLSESEFQKFINGNNQKGVIQFSHYCLHHNRRSKDNELILHETYQLDDKLLNNKDSYYVLESIIKNLTKNEFRALLESGVIFRRFCNEIQYPEGNTFISDMWALIEEQFQEKELTEILIIVFKNMQFPEIEQFEIMAWVFVDFIGTRISNLFSKIEIFDLFIKNEVFFELVKFYNDQNSNWFWDVIVKFTTRDERKIILKQKKNCSIEICHHFCFLLHVISKYSFNKLKQVYDEHFNKMEIQEIIFSHSNDFLLYLVTYEYTISMPFRLKPLIEYLQYIFTGNEKALKKFLMQKIEPSNKNIFEWSESFDIDGDNKKIFHNMLNNLTMIIEQNGTKVIP